MTQSCTEAVEESSSVHFDLGWYSDVSVVQHTRTQASEGLASGINIYI